MSQRFLSVLRMTRRAAVPTGGLDGDVVLNGDFLWSNNAGVWQRLNIQYFNEAAIGHLHVWTSTVTTDSTGTATFTPPSGNFAAIHSAVPVVIRNTTAPANFAFAYVRTQTTTSIVCQVAESKNTGILIGGTVEGLEPSGAGISVSITVFGV